MAEIRYNNSFSLAGGFNITNAEPIDSRMYVADIAHIYLDENWTKVKPYAGLIVSDPNGEVRVCVNSNYKLESSWKKIGGNGNVSVATIEEAEELAIEENIGQVIYVSGENVAYIVTGVGVLMKLATSTAGDIDSIVASLQADVKSLLGVVGGEESGLVKDVKELQDAVAAIEIPEVPVQDVKVNGESVLDESGVAVIELPDFETFAKADVVSGLEGRFGEFETSFEETKESINGSISVLDERIKTNEGKLETISKGAQVNAIEVVKVNGSALVVADSDKSVDIIIPTAPVQGVASGENIISLEDGKLKSTLTLAYVPATESEHAVLRLQGINGEVVTSIDATNFVKDGILSGARLEGPNESESGEKYLVLSFNTDAGKEDIRIDVSELLNYYTAGDGLELTGNVFGLKVNSEYLEVSTEGLSVSQKLFDKVTELDNAVISSVNAYTDNAVSTSASQTLESAKGYADGLNGAMNTRVEALEAIKHEDFALSADVYTKEDADSTFVKVSDFNEFEEGYEEKLNGIEEGAQVNKIETVSVNGIGATIEGKTAKVKIEADDIELGTAITNGEDVKYASDTKISVVLQGIQESIRGAIAGGVNSVTAGDTVISVNSADANNPVISLSVESSSEESIANGHIELIKSNEGLYGVMYYDGDDME